MNKSQNKDFFCPFGCYSVAKSGKIHAIWQANNRKNSD